MMRKSLLTVFILVGLVMLLTSGQALAVPGGATQTAQSVMVKLDFDSPAYEIQGTITWTYLRNTCAVLLYDAHPGVYNNATPTCTGGGSGNVNCLAANQPDTPSAPAIPTTGPNSVVNHAQDDRCIFFNGGTVPGWTYTQTATIDGKNGHGNWTFTFNYATDGGDVGEHTCWDSVVNGDSFVDVGFSGFISSESFQKINQGGNNTRTKYSFTAIDGGVSRVRNVVAQLQMYNGSEWVDVGDPIPFGTNDGTGNYILDVTPTTEDYEYYGNAGVFGNGTVYGYLHAPGNLPAALVTAILASDSFANNDDDLASGNVHQANFGDTFFDLGMGDYRILLTGTIKGNGGISDFDFGVTGSLTQIGGCSNP